ncbi:MAG TPA: competence/damage-inducible protein A [Bacteroidia bacterium]|nr:competence/damage-inducible protein A [Bacteroidia bacterium]
MITAQVITIGDEILIGQIVDTNSAFISQRMSEAGIQVTRKISVGDKENEIISAIDIALKESDIVLMTGGLGPTKDDITKLTLCKYFNSSLRFDEETYKNVEALFKASGKAVTEINRRQAEVPENCTVLPNKRGTAPGMWFEKENHVLISMPGVPQEMKVMMEESVIPKLKEKFKTPYILHRNILTQGIGESALAEMIEEWENNLLLDMRLAYLPSTGQVRLRISTTGENKSELQKRVEEKVKQLQLITADFIYGYDDDTLESLVGKLLREKKATLCTAESCTGGYIAHKITSVPGSSDYFIGSVVAYANEVKENFLNVPYQVIEKYGAVSEQVVKLMAENARNIFGTDYSVACSGIAGPDGGTEEKPVGTVWIAVATPVEIKTKLLRLGKGRLKVIEETALNVLNMLRKEMVK